jgi:glucose-1-phosphate cytidylyltransferase
MSDVTIDLSDNSTHIHRNASEPWKVTLVDTGENTMTGGRIKRIEPYVGNAAFMLTYGDGLSDINIADLQKYHNVHGRLATLTAVKPPGRYGMLDLGDGAEVRRFAEKPAGDGGYVNGGFFVCEPEVFDYVGGDDSIWERTPLERLASDSQLVAYKHDSFWYAMDTLRDKNHLEMLWQSGKAPWKVWE